MNFKEACQIRQISRFQRISQFLYLPTVESSMFFSFLKKIKPIILIAKKSLNLNRNILYIDLKIPRSY